jgi:hypothetical protein
VLHRVVEHVGIHGDAPPGPRDVVLLAHQLLEVLPRLERPHVEGDADLLELLAQDLARLHEHRHLGLHQIGKGEAPALAGVGEELLRPREVGPALVDVHVGGPGARLRGRLGGDGMGVVVDELHDLRAVERPGDGLTEPLVVERRAARVEHEEEGKVGPPGGGLHVARALQLGDALGRDRLDPVVAPGLQPGEPHGVVGGRIEDDAVEVGAAGPEVLVPALEGDVVVLHPLDELEGAGADGEELGVLLGDGLLVDDLGGLGQHGEERPVRAAQVEAHLVRTQRLHALHRREEDPHGQLVLGVEEPVEGEGHVLRGEGLAVVEYGVVDEVENPRLLAVLLPGLRQAGGELSRLVHVDELVVDVLVHLERGVELGEARVHVHGLVDGGHAEGAAALGLALRPGRALHAGADEGAEPYAGGEPAQTTQPLPSRAVAPVRSPRVVRHGAFLLVHS